MAKLNQIIAVEKGAKSTLENEITRVYHLIQRSEVFNGITREYQPKDDEGETLPSEGTNVIANVEELVQAFSISMTKLFDITATKTQANTLAKANVVVDGTIILADMPVELLLFLEKRLADVKTFLSKLPVLDPAQKWELDGSAGVYKTPPVTTHRSKKVPFNHVKAPATDKHPAQVDVLFEDVTVGFWNTTKFSGAAPATQIKEWKDRVAKLQAAVQMAREEANSMTVEDVAIGQKVFTHIFGDLGQA